jgi:hypothetical protein
MKKSILAASLLSLALLGFGCKQPETQPQVPNAVAPVDGSGSTQAPTSQPAPGVSRDVLYARQVLRNLSQANTFRAAMVVPSAGGIINTTLDYNRANGLIGKVTLPTTAGPQTAELYANDTEIWFRDGTSTWQNLSNTEEGQDFRTIFQNAFGYQSQYQSTVSDTAKLTSKDEDTSANCTRHAFTQTVVTGAEQRFTLCIAADLPVYLTIEGPYGQIEVRYRDVNGNVEVKKPI